VDPERSCSQNITLQTIQLTASDSISVCGETINDTDVNSAGSALEAICVSPQGDQRLQLARQLTAMALNCLASGWGAACQSAPTGIQTLWTTCNSACTSNSTLVAECVGRVDCFNNGGTLNANGQCITGACSGTSPAVPCGPEVPCASGECQETASCHTRELPSSVLGGNASDCPDPGPAGSSTTCKAARKTPCQIVGPGEAACPAATNVPD
jgi:hypothetical protein